MRNILKNFILFCVMNVKFKEKFKGKKTSYGDIYVIWFAFKVLKKPYIVV